MEIESGELVAQMQWNGIPQRCGIVLGKALLRLRRGKRMTLKDVRVLYNRIAGNVEPLRSGHLSAIERGWRGVSVEQLQILLMLYSSSGDEIELWRALGEIGLRYERLARDIRERPDWYRRHW